MVPAEADVCARGPLGLGAEFVFFGSGMAAQARVARPAFGGGRAGFGHGGGGFVGAGGLGGVVTAARKWFIYCLCCVDLVDVRESWCG